MKSLDKEAALFYAVKTNHNKTGSFVRYTKPFVLSKTTDIQVYAEKKGARSATVTQRFYKVPSDRSITVKSEVHPMYTAGGKDALIDGITGTTNWKTGEWQSYFAQDFEAVIDLQQVRPVQYLGIHVLQEVSPWIVFPKEVRFEISRDGRIYQPLRVVKNEISMEEKGPVVQEMGTKVKATGRFIKIIAVSGGSLPAWHESAGQPTHIFIDEVIVK